MRSEFAEAQHMLPHRNLEDVYGQCISLLFCSFALLP